MEATEMVQRGTLKSNKIQSKGAARKKIGYTAKHKKHNSIGRNKIRDQATAQYVNAIEGQMASRLPSDQRDKLSVVRSSGPIDPKKNRKKPLTRGRSRKGTKGSKGKPGKK
jgi:hypothetical protein